MQLIAALNLPGSKRRKQTPLELSRSEVLAMLRAAANSYRGHGFDSMIVYSNDSYQGQKGGLLQTSENSIHFTNDISFVICWNQINVGGDITLSDRQGNVEVWDIRVGSKAASGQHEAHH